MKRTDDRQTRQKGLFAYILIIIAVIAIVAGLVFAHALSTSQANDRKAIRRAVLSRAVQCAAVEGSYPEDISYLEHNYGLRYNHDRYIVIYEPMGNNVTPQVTVLYKK